MTYFHPPPLSLRCPPPADPELERRRMARQYEMYLQTRQAPDNCYLWVLGYLWLWLKFVRYVSLICDASCWTAFRHGWVAPFWQHLPTTPLSSQHAFAHKAGSSVCKGPVCCLLDAGCPFAFTNVLQVPGAGC